MRSFVRVLSWLTLGLGLMLCLLGVAALPDGGLMFALPYVFLFPGVLLAIVGGLVLFFTRARPGGPLDENAGSEGA
jgi:hypothetical protein